MKEMTMMMKPRGPTGRRQLWLQRLICLAFLAFQVAAGTDLLSKEANDGARSKNARILSDSSAGDRDDMTTNSTFCHGTYMTVFMDGFRWSLGAGSKDASDDHHHHHHHHDHDNSTDSSTPPCLAYYVRSWKLSEKGKFRGAMVFSFLLALLTEGLSASRIVLLDYLRHPAFLQQRKLALTAVYALQSWLGTLIMLVAMMYSIEMLFSVVAGLMAGNYLFVRERQGKPPTHSSRTAGGPLVSGGLSSSDALPTTPTGGVARRNLAEEGQQGLCCNNEDSNSVEGLGSIGGLQMQTRKEE